MIQKAEAMGNWWWAASSQQHACSGITSSAEFFGKTSNNLGDSALLQPRFDALWVLDFPKSKTSFEREEISDHPLDSEEYDGASDGNWRTVCGPQVTTLKGIEVSLSYVQCFLYLVSSSTNVSIFHITWSDTFWTDLVCMCVCVYTHIYIKYTMHNLPTLFSIRLNSVWLTLSKVIFFLIFSILRVTILHVLSYFLALCESEETESSYQLQSSFHWNWQKVRGKKRGEKVPRARVVNRVRKIKRDEKAEVSTKKKPP